MFKRRLVKLGLHDSYTQPLSPRIPNDRWMKKCFAGPLIVTSGPVSLNHQAMLWNVHVIQPCFQRREGRLIRHAVLAMLRWTLDKNRSSGHRLLIAGRSGKTCRIWKLIKFPCVPLLVNVSISSASQWSQGQFSFTPYQFSWGCKFPSCQIVIKKHQVIARNIKPIQSTRHAKTKPISKILTRPWPLWFARIAAHQLHAKPSMPTNCPMGIYLDRPSEELGITWIFKKNSTEEWVFSQESAETTHC